MKRIDVIVFILFFHLKTQAQTPVAGHSHNDYTQKHPFKTAFDAKMGSIEADVHLWNDSLYVAHDKEDIKNHRTLNSLYLKPIYELLEKGKAHSFILLIDIKTQGDSTLDEIVKLIKQYPLFLTENCPIQFVISGNRPTSEKWVSYPPFIFFDGRPTEIYTPSVLQRVGMVSNSFEKYTSQKGEKHIDNQIFTKMKSVVDSVHAQGKKMRFWATPDKKSVWEALAKMGVDFTNTDKPKALRKFLRS